MSQALWQPAWVQNNTVELAMSAFRMVETQYIAATMRLVDSANEQALLEQMLDDSKPPMPLLPSVHYLLAAPFRYLPTIGSRFRSANMPGLWYGAADAYCACAEIAYWRQKFLLDSAGLLNQHLTTEHSMYEAAVSGRAIDLTAEPWRQAAAAWTHTSDYAETQKLGQLVRESNSVAWIHYASARATGHTCAAVFDPLSLTMVTKDSRYEQWYCHTTKDSVTLSNGVVRFDF